MIRLEIRQLRSPDAVGMRGPPVVQEDLGPGLTTSVHRLLGQVRLCLVSGKFAVNKTRDPSMWLGKGQGYTLVEISFRSA